MLKILEQIKQKIMNRKQTVEEKIRDLENKRTSLKAQLDREFDKKVEAELASKTYDETQIKRINAELIEIQGLLEAYNKQLNVDVITEQDKQSMLQEAAEEYKQLRIESLKNQKERLLIDIQLRELLKKGRSIRDISCSKPIEELCRSGFFNVFPDDPRGRNTVKNENHITGLLDEIGDIGNNSEFENLSKEIKELSNRNTYLSHMYLWDEMDGDQRNINELAMRLHQVSTK